MQRDDPTFRIRGVDFDPALNRFRTTSNWRSLEPRIMALLLVLARNENRVVSRDALLDEVWGEGGSDEALTQSISALRSVFADRADSPRVIETIRKKGYRLIAPVERLDAADEPTHMARPGGRFVPASLHAVWRRPTGELRRVSLLISLAAGVLLLVVLALFRGDGIDPDPDYELDIEDADVELDTRDDPDF